MVKKSKKGAKTKAQASAGVSCNTGWADGPSGGGATPSCGVDAGSSGTRNCFRCQGNIQDATTYHRRRLASALIMTIVALPAMVLAAQQPAQATDKRFGSRRRRRRNQEVGLLDLLAGGGGGSGGGFQGEDGINMILDGLYQNNVDVDVDVVGIINQCLVAGKGNMDINCFIGKLDEQIPDFDVKEMAEQMGVGTEPCVPPPALDCPSGETDVKSFQIPVTGEYCAVCIPFHARTICGFSCSCSNGDCGCSLKPPDCPGTLICAGTDGHDQEELPSEPAIGVNGTNADGAGADDATLEEIPEDTVALEGGGSTLSEMAGNSSTAFFGGDDSIETGEDLEIQEEPDGIVDYNVTSTSTEGDLAVLLQDADNETEEATSASPDQAWTITSSQLPRNDENSSSARMHDGLGIFSLPLGLLVPATLAILS